MILAITGPTGSGKTTIGEAIAKKFNKCVNIDADHIKHMIVSGFYKDVSNAGGWSFSEWALVGESIGLLVNNFQAKGFDVVINGYIDEPAWEAIEKCITINYKILLLPDIKTNTIRDSGRNADIQMGEPSIIQHHEHFREMKMYEDFTVLDTTSDSVETTIQRVMELINL